MAGPGVNVKFESQDELSAAIDRINKRLDGMRAPARKAETQLQRFSRMSGLNALGTGLNKVGAGAERAFFSIGRIVPELGAITGAASIAGLYKLASAWANTGNDVVRASQRMGIAVPKLQALSAANELAGGSASSAADGLGTLQQGMWEAVQGHNGALIASFARLHISWRNADGSLKDAHDVFLQLTKVIAGTRDPITRLKIATDFLGSSGADLLPLMLKGVSGVQRLEQEAKDLGVVFDDGGASSERLFEAQKRLELSTRGLGYAIADALEPAITPMLDTFSKWIQAHREIIATKVTAYLGEFETWAKRAWKQADGIAQSLGGWPQAAKDAGYALAGLYAVKTLAGLGQVLSMTGGILKNLGLISKISLAAFGGYEADKELRKVDPDDKAGTWMDRNVPGAAWADNEASKVGFGRSYQEQMDADPDRPEGTPLGNALRRWSGGLTKQGKNRSREAMDWFMSQEGGGYSLPQAAGLAGNIQEETGGTFSEKLPGDNGQAYGIAQWHPRRQAAIEAHFHKAIRDMTFPEELQAMSWELSALGPEADAGAALRKQKTAYDAGSTVSLAYERPLAANVEASLRGGNAQTRETDYLRHLRGMQPDEGVDTAPALSTPAPPVNAPPASVPDPMQHDALAIAMARLTVDVNHKNAPPGSSVKVSSSSPAIKVASVKTERAMDPAMTPNGF